jgi:hypothetical protein
MYPRNLYHEKVITGVGYEPNASIRNPKAYKQLPSYSQYHEREMQWETWVQQN